MGITNNNNNAQSSPYKMIDVETARTNMACQEAYRHLIAENKNLKSSMERFHNVLSKRQVNKKRCFLCFSYSFVLNSIPPSLLPEIFLSKNKLYEQKKRNIDMI